MKDRSHRRAHRGKLERGKKDFVCPLLLRVLCGRCSFVLLLVALLTSSTAAQNQTRQPLSPERHLRYHIELALDSDKLTYTGTERVRFVNRGEHSTSTLYFHLYPNMRVPGYVPPRAEPGQQTSDEPRLEITGVRSPSDGALLMYELDDLGTTLRINLREPVAPNAATEIEIK